MENVVQKPEVITQFPKQNGPEMLKKIPKGTKGKNSLFIILTSLAVVLLGVGTGWMLSGKTEGKTQTFQDQSEGIVEKSENEAGIADESEFSESVEGTLVEGGIENEGTHHLERSGGVSQNVYLTSTVIDLQSFVGKKVQVWGDTLSGQKAGWLMDVGKIKAVE